MKVVNGRVISFLLSLLLIVATVFVLLRIDFGQYLQGTTQLWDFDVYYRLASDSVRGIDPYQVSYMQTAGPPLVILPFVLFVTTSLSVARSCMAIVSLLAIWGTAYVLAKTIWPARVWLLALSIQLILLLSFPVRFNFITGQPNLILMFLTTILITSNAENMKGLAAGLMIVIKTNYLLILVALLRHHFRAVLVAVTVLVVATLFSLLILKPQTYSNYFNQRAPSYLLSRPVVLDVDYYNQSLRSTLARFELGNWYVALFVSLAVVAVSYLVVSGDIRGGVLFSIVLSPIVWQHYIVVVYPILILVGIACWSRRWLFILWSVSAFLLLTHFSFLDNHALDFWHSLQASHYFFGLVLLLMIQVWLHSRRHHE